MAVVAAAKSSLSLNVWIERVIRKACAELGIRPLERIAEQTSIDDFVGEPDVKGLTDQVDSGVSGATPAPTEKYRRFAADCVAGAYHWKHRPGHPCRSCEGEI